MELTNKSIMRMERDFFYMVLLVNYLKLDWCACVCVCVCGGGRGRGCMLVRSVCVCVGGGGGALYAIIVFGRDPCGESVNKSRHA